MAVPSTEEECPDLLPTTGSDSTAKLSLVVRADTIDSPDGAAKPTQAEWVIEVRSLAEPVKVDDLMGLLFEPLQKCRTPVSLYGFSTNFNTWRKLPSIVMVDEDEDSGHHHGAGDDAMEEDDESMDGDVTDESGDEGGEWMDDDDDTFSDLLLGVWLVSDAQQNDKQLELMDAKSLKRAQNAITAALRPLRPKSVAPRTDPSEGAARAQAVCECVPICDLHVAIMLRPLEGRSFNTAVVFDALLSLGMQYQAHSRQFVFRGPVLDSDGCTQVDDLFMAVPTYSAPGASTELQIEYLKLGFFVPYTPEPLAVLNGVISAAGYVARRQGGALVYDEAGIEGPEAVFQEAARSVQQAMSLFQQLGISPGSTDAQMLY